MLWTTRSGQSAVECGPLGAFDAVLCAVALESGADAPVSADRAFAAVPGLHHVVPDADGVAQLLGPSAGTS